MIKTKNSLVFFKFEVFYKVYWNLLQMKNFHINLSLESSYAIQTCFNKSKNQTEPQC